MAGDDEEEEGKWSPEDDKIEHKFLKKLMRKMNKEERKEDEREKASRESREKLSLILQHRIQAQSLPAYDQPARFPADGVPMITIRPIENGFLVSYIEPVRHGPSENVSSLGSEKLKDSATVREGPESAVDVGVYFSTRQVEVFVRDSAEAVQPITRAMEAAQEIFKLGMPR